ncbi:MAG: hypothetical protein F6K61_16735 [Sphaerospermopsis sp. SIO1G1]|nr:hypothetical protein [Sphaerospermopsis sp. SIO1G1]
MANTNDTKPVKKVNPELESVELTDEQLENVAGGQLTSGLQGEDTDSNNDDNYSIPLGSYYWRWKFV